jgi:Kef-type K+ transport system membrane component KefB
MTSAAASPKAGDASPPSLRLAVVGAVACAAPDMTTTALLPAAASASFSVDTGSFLAIVATSAVAATIVAVAGGRNLFVPVVVVELALGVLIGPQVADLAKVDGFTQFFADLGLGMLFFFAGYEIDIARIRGHPLRLALLGWALSLVIAYTLGGLLAAAGVVVSLVYVGSALATTAIGTLLPILSDTGEMRTRFGTYLLAAGAVGEFGPILLLTLVLSTRSTLHNALILIAFVGLAVAVAVVAVRSSHRTIPVFEQTIEKSSQLAVRWIVVLVFALTLLASDLGLDLLLGGFAAGLITRQVLQKQEVPSFDSKLTAVAFGVFIPFFFVVSGMRLDVDALFASASGVLKVAVFFVLFLVVRGTPAMLLYRGVLPLREDRMALALFTATQLPLVVAITTVAVDAGEMRSSTAAALVGAGALSTLAGPLHGLRMRRIAALKRVAAPRAEGLPADEAAVFRDSRPAH